MNRALYEFFTADHRRLEGILDRATKQAGLIDMELYHRFRVGLLTHIKMEEKILFPAAKKANGQVPIPLADKLRLDHGAITALMVIPPDEQVIKVLRYILERHDLLEEAEGGMYDICENLTKEQTGVLLEQLHSTTEVPVNPFNEALYAAEAMKRALKRAGFDFDEIAMA